MRLGGGCNDVTHLGNPTRTYINPKNPLRAHVPLRWAPHEHVSKVASRSRGLVAWKILLVQPGFKCYGEKMKQETPLPIKPPQTVLSVLMNSNGRTVLLGEKKEKEKKSYRDYLVCLWCVSYHTGQKTSIDYEVTCGFHRKPIQEVCFCWCIYHILDQITESKVISWIVVTLGCSSSLSLDTRSI